MTDYTPEQLDNIADFAADIANDTAEALAEYPRLKEERDELLEALTWVVDQVDRFGGITIENNHSIFEKFRALIAKVEK